MQPQALAHLCVPLCQSHWKFVEFAQKWSASQALAPAWVVEDAEVFLPHDTVFPFLLSLSNLYNYAPEYMFWHESKSRYQNTI